jgi:hypothetical protein
MTLDTTAILIIVLIVCIIILAGLVIRLEMKLKRFLVTKGASSIDDSLTKLAHDTKELQTFRKELEAYLKTVEKRIRRSVQAIHTLRFNPFKGTGSGGNQSFATAFMNEEGDGVVISSLYSREHVSIFSKPIKKSSSEFELTVEEKAALSEARKNIS